jgi:hypothetical protein
VTTHIDLFRTRPRTLAGIATAGAAAALLAACGASTGPGSLSLPTLPAGLGATPSPGSGPTSGNLGDTLVMEDSGDDIAHVTITQIVDPAVVDDTAGSPPDGTRWVGIEGTIVINGARSGQDSTAVEAIGSDGQTYGFDSAYALHSFAGCTPNGPDDGLPPGAVQALCSGVGLPPGVTVAKVGYSTEGVDGGATAKLWWTVADSGASAPTATPTDTPEATPTDTPEATPTDTPESTPTDTPESTPTATPGT